MAPKKNPPSFIEACFNGDTVAVLREIADRIERGDSNVNGIEWKMTDERFVFTLDMEPEAYSR